MRNKIGVQSRENNRTKNKQNIPADVTKRLIADFANEILFKDKILFEEAWNNFDKYLIKQATSSAHYAELFELCASKLNEKVTMLGFVFQLSTYMLPMTIDKTIRNESLIEMNSGCCDFYNDWFTDTLSGHTNNIEDAFRNVIMSLIYHSGCCKSNYVMAFSKQLNESIDIKQINELAYLPLFIDDKKYNTNITRHGIQLTKQIVYLSTLTLSFIAHFQHLRSLKNNHDWTTPLSERQIYARLTSGRKNSSSNTNFPTSLTRLLKAALMIVEQHAGVELNQAMIEFSLGNIKAYSLSEDNLSRIAPSSPLAICDLRSFHHQVSNSNSTSGSTLKLYSQKPSGLLFAKISKIVNAKNETKINKKLFVEKLEAIKIDLELSQAEIILLEWLIAKFETCVQSTIIRYHSTVSKAWLYHFEALCVDDFDESNYHERYTEMLEQTSSGKQKYKLGARLRDIHTFGINHYNFPHLTEKIFDGSDFQAHTNAGFIDETLFNALLLSVNNLLDLSDRDQNTLKTILIISYRCNLRISEILKLQMRDIECSEIGWISVRPNKFANNKSHSSTRKVPLYPMLLEHEYTIVFETLRLASELNYNSGSNLIFTFGINNTVRINQNLVSNFTQNSLRVMSGIDNFVFHHLRHSAISRMQVMVEISNVNQYYPEIVPYPDEQQKRIIKLICAETVSNKYYAIANFDGHATPETCFSNYFHFSDLILQHKLSLMLLQMTQKQIVDLGICSRIQLRKINNAVTKKTTFTAQQLLPLILQNMDIKKLFFQIDNAQVHTIKSTEALRNGRIEMAICQRVLQNIDEGMAPEQLAHNFRIPAETINKWHKNSFELSLQQTTYHQPRHRKKDHFEIAPTLPNTSAEKDLVSKIINRIRDQYSQDKTNILLACEYALAHKSNSKSGVYFNTPEELEHFLNTFSFCIAKSQWRILTCSFQHSTNNNRWDEACKGIDSHILKVSSSEGRSGKGTAWLELKHPKENEIIANTQLKKYSSSCLMYFIKMLYIMTHNPHKMANNHLINGDC
ncbi:tyrosine-type recombinase/integrase [Shewanella frigidimarina]|uniref:tyrosine-type recombinase/integrase n=1 Tax=Shewanella frigidimarina TaxID=56812 RepID=UPI003D7B3792